MDQHTQHVISATAAPTAVLAFFTQWNPVLTTIVALAALCWYGVLFYDRFCKDRRSKETNEH